MFQQFVVGTLTTINAFIGPNGSIEPNAEAHFRLTASEHSRTCLGSKPGTLTLQLNKLTDSYIRALVKGQVCTSGALASEINEPIFLPIELMDRELLQNLSINQSYVVHGLPLNNVAGSRGSMKFTKREVVKDMMAIQLEWLPNRDGNIPHAPMTLWMKAASTQVPMPWVKMQFSAGPAALIDREIVIAGPIMNVKMKRAAEAPAATETKIR